MYAGRRWPRDLWLTALWRSRSGTRLKVILDGLPDVHIDNTTPIVGATPDSVIPTDRKHVRRLLAADPGIVLACGKQAERAITKWRGALVVMPHPTWRCLSNEALGQVRDQLLEPIPAGGCP